MNLIVNTDLVRVIDTGKEYQMLITCKNGTVVEHEPFKRNLEGLVAAISLSAEICAGKFFLSGVAQINDILKDDFLVTYNGKTEINPKRKAK